MFANFWKSRVCPAAKTNGSVRGLFRVCLRINVSAPQNTKKYRIRNVGPLLSRPSSVSRLHRKLILLPSVGGRGNYLRGNVLSVLYSISNINILNFETPTFILSPRQMAIEPVSVQVYLCRKRGQRRPYVSSSKFISILCSTLSLIKSKTGKVTKRFNRHHLLQLFRRIDSMLFDNDIAVT